MEQIAVYIIIIAILILSSLRKSKKQQQAKIEQLKKQQQLQEDDTGFRTESIKDVFNKYTENLFEEPTKVPEIQVVEKKVKKTDNFLNYELQNVAKKHKTITQRKKIVHEENYFEKMLKNQEISEQTKSEIDTDIDWTNAVIYSEILNRKYA